MEEGEHHARALEKARVEAFERILLIAGESENVKTLAYTYTLEHSKVRAIEEEKSAITRRISHLRATNERNRSHLATVTSTITSESTKYNFLCDSIDTLHESMVDSFSQICTVGSSVDAVAVRELETKYDRICADLEDMYESIREQESADGEAKNSAMLLVPLVGILDDKTLEDYRREHAEYQATCDKHTALQKMVLVLETDIRNKRDESSKIQGEVVSSQNNLQKESILLSRLDHIESSIDLSEAELAFKNEVLLEVSNEIMLLRENELAMKSALSDISGELARKKDELARKKDELAHISLEVIAKESDLMLLSQQSSDLQKSIENTQNERSKQHQEEDARSSKMRQDYAECEIALVEMQQELAVLEDKIEVSSTVPEEAVLANKKDMIQHLEGLLVSAQQRLDLKDELLLLRQDEIALSNTQHTQILKESDEIHAEYILQHNAMRDTLDSQLEEMKRDVQNLTQQKNEMLEAKSLETVVFSLPIRVEQQTEACHGECAETT